MCVCVCVCVCVCACACVTECLSINLALAFFFTLELCNMLIFMKLVAAPVATHQCYVNWLVVKCGMSYWYEEGEQCSLLSQFNAIK